VISEFDDLCGLDLFSQVAQSSISVFVMAGLVPAIHVFLA
jgi:hypothetical protein